MDCEVKLMYIQCSDGDDGEGEVEEEEEGVGGGLRGSNERSMEGQEEVPLLLLQKK